MFFDIWTIINPVLRTLVYITVLTTIGTILFQFHFNNFFDKELSNYCRVLIKKMSVFGLFISLVVFLSVAGNLGGDLYSTTDLSLLILAFETLSGKSAILLFLGFFVIIISIFINGTFSSLTKFLGIILILSSFIIVGHSTSKGLSTQTLIVIHIFCISFWLGSFLPLRFMCMNKNSKNLSVISEKFGEYAIFYISSLLVTGLIFSYILVGGIDALISTNYGIFLMVKLFSVSTILFLGALNKFRLVPHLRVDYDKGTARLKNSIQVEIMITLIILFLTSILTTSLTTPMGV